MVHLTLTSYVKEGWLALGPGAAPGWLLVPWNTFFEKRGRDKSVAMHSNCSEVSQGGVMRRCET